MSSLLEGGVGWGEGASGRFGGPWSHEHLDVCSGPVFPGVGCGDGARIAVLCDGIFGWVVGISICVSCTVISGALEINRASVSTTTFSAASRSFSRRIPSTGWGITESQPPGEDKSW